MNTNSEMMGTINVEAMAGFAHLEANITHLTTFPATQ